MLIHSINFSRTCLGEYVGRALGLEQYLQSLFLDWSLTSSPRAPSTSATCCTVRNCAPQICLSALVSQTKWLSSASMALWWTLNSSPWASAPSVWTILTKQPMTTLRLNFEGLKAAPGDAVESSYFLSNILGPVPTPALFTNVNYISNIIIAHTGLSKET